LKGGLETVLTGSDPLAVKSGTEDVKKIVVRWIQYEIRVPMAISPGVKWPYSMRADGQHGDVVAVAFGD